MKDVEFLKERRMSGFYYAVGDTATINDNTAYSLAQNGVVRIICEDIVLSPKSVTQTYGTKNL